MRASTQVGVVELRPLRPEDFVQAARCFDSQEEYVQATDGSAPSGVEDVALNWEEARRTPGRELWGLYVGGLLVGLADGNEGAGGEVPSWIGLLLVGKGHEGHGYGRQAALALIDRLPAPVRVAVLQSSARGQRFWRGLGFFKVGEKTLVFAGRVAEADVLELRRP